MCQEWPEISYILSSGQGCKDVRSHDSPSIWILQLEVQVHNTVVLCIHFVCVHIDYGRWNIVKHTNTLALLGGVKHQVQYTFKVTRMLIFRRVQPFGKP